MGKALGVDDDVAVMLEIEVVEVQAATDVALTAIRQARAARNSAAVRKLRDELRQRRDRITRLVDAIYRNDPAAEMSNPISASIVSHMATEERQPFTYKLLDRPAKRHARTEILVIDGAIVGFCTHVQAVAGNGGLSAAG
jgi:hypothetical protein